MAKDATKQFNKLHEKSVIEAHRVFMTKTPLMVLIEEDQTGIMVSVIGKTGKQVTRNKVFYESMIGVKNGKSKKR